MHTAEVKSSYVGWYYKPFADLKNHFSSDWHALQNIFNNIDHMVCPVSIFSTRSLVFMINIVRFTIWFLKNVSFCGYHFHLQTIAIVNFIPWKILKSIIVLSPRIFILKSSMCFMHVIP